MAEIFQPTRAEPFFEPIPGLDVASLKITVVWATYLDNLGDGLNQVSIELDGGLSELQSEIGQARAELAQVKKKIKDIEALLNDY